VPFKVFSGGSKYSAGSLARSLLADGRGPLALVLDADSSSRGQVAAEQVYWTELMATVAGDIPVEVVLVEPEMEALLFSHPGLVGHLLHQSVTPEQELRGRFQPKVVLAELTAPSGKWSLEEAVQRLRDEDLDRLAADGPFLALAAFIRRLPGEAVSAQLAGG
jgi:hypothetical protein